MNILEVDNSLLTFSGVFKISFSCLKQIICQITKKDIKVYTELTSISILMITLTCILQTYVIVFNWW